MGYPLFLSTLVIALTLSKTCADVSSLQDNNRDYLDPIHDQEQDLTDNNQDKRTICSALNKCGSKSSYVKRLVIKNPQFLSLSPLIRPVSKPVVFGGYRYIKPKFHYRLKAPATINGGWRPVQSASRPAVIGVAGNKPHVDVIHNNPSPHVDHLSPSDVHNVGTPVVRPVQPVQPAFVHLRPVAIPAPHVDQIHQVNVPHGNHFDSFTHVDHLQPGTVAQPVVPIAQPVVPVAQPPTLVKPFVPSPVLFEVTRPNLGVLPFGARFQSPVLREYPHVHLHPVSPPPVASAVPVAPVPQPVQGIIHTSVGLPHILPQPGVSVEYHGSKNFLALQGGVPFLQQTPVEAVQHIPHHHNDVGHLHGHQHLPVDHAHNVAPQQALPFDHTHGFAQIQQHALPLDQSHAFAQAQQALPFDHTHVFSQSQRALPNDNGAQFLSADQQFQQQQQQQYQYQDIPNGQLPLEGEQQQSFDQYLQNNQEQTGLNIQHFDQNNVIQPGQTDVQIPYHLPQHQGWSAVQQQEEGRSFGEQDFRPSPQLEAPYKK